MTTRSVSSKPRFGGSNTALGGSRTRWGSFHARRAAAVALTGAVLLTAAPLAISSASAPMDRSATPAAAPSKTITWLSTGDSYSSGEGIDLTGTGTDYCAQSSKAYGPQARKILQSQRGWKVGASAFSACTGLMTGHFYNAQTPGKGSLLKWSEEQTSPGQRFDVVTFSFGGNDIGFGTILTDCVMGRLLTATWDQAGQASQRTACKATAKTINNDIGGLIAGLPPAPKAPPYGPGRTQLTMEGFYRQVAEHQVAPGGVLVVVGYPRLFAPSATWPAWRGGFCGLVGARDADLLGDAAISLENALRGAVDTARSSLTDGRRIEYVSRLELFDASPSHSLCGGQLSWLNGLSTGFWDSSARREHAYHPNALGHLATAELVAGRVEADFPGTPSPGPQARPAPEAPQATQEVATVQAPEAPPATQAPPANTPPPIRAEGTSHYEIGDPFSDQCYVAWPTAPTHTQTTIQMTMHCSHQPAQFLFTSVVYGDPNLQVTPSTGNMLVTGHIVDYATSGYGFKELVVQADQVQLPNG
ncbi:MAG TPA: SGNH/GDSL hydrolase family protein [Dermatophilaceae bacterium]